MFNFSLISASQRWSSKCCHGWNSEWRTPVWGLQNTSVSLPLGQGQQQRFRAHHQWQGVPHWAAHCSLQEQFIKHHRDSQHAWWSRSHWIHVRGWHWWQCCSHTSHWCSQECYCFWLKCCIWNKRVQSWSTDQRCDSHWRKLQILSLRRIPHHTNM